MVRLARLSAENPRRPPRVSRFRQGLRRGRGFRTPAFLSRPPVPHEGRGHPQRRRGFRRGFRERIRRQFRTIRRGRPRYRRRRVRQYLIGWRMTRSRPLALTRRNPARAFALGFHRLRTLVPRIVVTLASVREVFRQGVKSRFRRGGHVHAFLNHRSRGLRHVGAARFRKRFRDVRLSGSDGSGFFEEFRRLGTRPFRRIERGRGERIEKRALPFLSQTLFGNSARTCLTRSGNQGGHRIQGRPQKLGEASVFVNRRHPLRSASMRGIRHRMRRIAFGNISGNLRIEDRRRAFRYRRASRRRRGDRGIQPSGVLVERSRRVKGIGEKKPPFRVIGRFFKFA